MLVIFTYCYVSKALATTSTEAVTQDPATASLLSSLLPNQ